MGVIITSVRPTHFDLRDFRRRWRSGKKVSESPQKKEKEKRNSYILRNKFPIEHLSSIFVTINCYCSVHVLIIVIN